MFANLWKNTREYFKINAIALIIIALAFTLITVLLLPHEKKTDKELADKFNAITQQYDEGTSNYKNLDAVTKLQNEATEIQSDNKIVKLINVVVIALLLVVITGMLSTLLQYIFTDMQFTKNKFSGEDGIYSETEKNNTMIVLAAALISAAVIVCVVFVVIYSA